MQSKDLQPSFVSSSRSLPVQIKNGPLPLLRITGGFRSNFIEVSRVAPDGTAGFRNRNASRRCRSASASQTNPGPIRDNSSGSISALSRPHVLAQVSQDKNRLSSLNAVPLRELRRFCLIPARQCHRQLAILG